METVYIALIDHELTAWAVGIGRSLDEARESASADYGESADETDPTVTPEEELDEMEISKAEYDRIREFGGIGWRIA